MVLRFRGVLLRRIWCFLGVIGVIVEGVMLGFLFYLVGKELRLVVFFGGRYFFCFGFFINRVVFFLFCFIFIVIFSCFG